MGRGVEPATLAVQRSRRAVEEGLRDKSEDGAKDAVGRLDQAIKLMPDDDKAYRLRGEAHT
jgi:hypothetical protein